MNKHLKHIDRWAELIIWILAILLLAFNDPFSEPQFSLCIFKQMGFNGCWGCGLGKSISFLIRGEIEKSLEAHAFGIPAFGILTFRILELFIHSIKKSTFSNN